MASDYSECDLTEGQASGFFKTPDGRTIEIRDVWASNLDEEMEKIRDLIEKYPFVSMVLFSHPFRNLFIFRTQNFPV